MDSRTLPPSVGERTAFSLTGVRVGCALAGVAFVTAVVLLLIPRSVWFDDAPAPAELTCGTAVAPEPWSEWDQPSDAYAGDLAATFASEYCPDALEQMRAGSAASGALGLCVLAILALRIGCTRRSAVVLTATAALSPLVLRVPLVTGGDYTWSSFEVSATWSWLLAGFLWCAALGAHLVRPTRPRPGGLRIAARVATLSFSVAATVSAVVLAHLASPQVFFGSGPTVAIYHGPSIYSIAPLLLGVVGTLAGIRDYHLTGRAPSR